MNRAYVLCNRYVSLTYFDSQLMGLILLKGSFTNSGHYLSMVKDGDILFECDDVKIIKIEFSHFCNFNTVHMLFYKWCIWWKHLRGIGLFLMDAAYWVSWGEDIEICSSLRPPSVHCFLSFTFATFLILWHLFPAASSVSRYWSCRVCSGLAYEIYSGGGPSMYVYCVVCYHVIASPYVKSVGHVSAYLYSLDDNLEFPMDYETSLLPNVFLYNKVYEQCHDNMDI